MFSSHKKCSFVGGFHCATGLAYESLLDINVKAGSRPMHVASKPLDLKEPGRQVTPLVTEAADLGNVQWDERMRSSRLPVSAELVFSTSYRTASQVGSVKEGKRTREPTEAELQGCPLPLASPLPASISFGQVVGFAKSLMLWKVGKQRKRK